VGEVVHQGEAARQEGAGDVDGERAACQWARDLVRISRPYCAGSAAVEDVRRHRRRHLRVAAVPERCLAPRGTVRVVGSPRRVHRDRRYVADDLFIQPRLALLLEGWLYSPRRSGPRD
jgi:hypothetical protein